MCVPVRASTRYASVENPASFEAAPARVHHCRQTGLRLPAGSAQLCSTRLEARAGTLIQPTTAWRGANRMMAAPNRQIPAPTTSHRSGRTFSTRHNHKIDATM